jgi:monovalent cation/proton antiporter MnhG/PhaG subunit
MTWQQIAAGALVLGGVGIALASCLGVLVMDDVYQRLHYVGPAALLAPLAIAAGVVVGEALSTAGIKALLIFAVLAGTAPILTHATARTARVRQSGRWQPGPDEPIEEL